MTELDLTIHQAYLPQDDPDAALAFYRDTLGFEVRMDVNYRGLRWITVGPPGQPGTSIVLHPPGADPGVTDDERRVIANTCFSIEPGIYLPEFGIRSEVNVFVGNGGAEVTGEIQRELLRIPVGA